MRKFFRQEHRCLLPVILAELQKNTEINKSVAKKTGENLESWEKLEKGRSRKGE